MGAERQEGYHFLVRELVPGRALDDSIQNQASSIGFAERELTIIDFFSGKSVPPNVRLEEVKSEN